LEYQKKAVNQAIGHSPLSGSIRIYKIKRLEELGKSQAAQKALQECMDQISPACESWLQ